MHESVCALGMEGRFVETAVCMSLCVSHLLKSLVEEHCLATSIQQVVESDSQQCFDLSLGKGWYLLHWFLRVPLGMSDDIAQNATSSIPVNIACTFAVHFQYWPRCTARFAMFNFILTWQFNIGLS